MSYFRNLQIYWGLFYGLIYEVFHWHLKRICNLLLLDEVSVDICKIWLVSGVSQDLRFLVARMPTCSIHTKSRVLKSPTITVALFFPSILSVLLHLGALLLGACICDYKNFPGALTRSVIIIKFPCLSLVAIFVLKFIFYDLSIATQALLGTVFMMYLLQSFHLQPICVFESEDRACSQHCHIMFFHTFWELCLLTTFNVTTNKVEFCITFQYLFTLCLMPSFSVVLIFLYYCLLLCSKDIF